MAKVIKLDTASKRYAYALYTIADKNNNLEEVKTEFAHIVEGFMSIPQWVAITKNPTLDHKAKAKKFLEGISKFNVIPEVENFFKVLVARQRTIFLQDIYKEFVNIYNFKKQIEVIVIETATKLTVAEKKKIETFVKEKSLTAKSVELDEVINEDLVSGFKFMFDAKQYDSSMRTKLDNLKKTFS
ncbi:MAG TPA: ATP synthase F1 subunit delta [Alphaproteobacteria bacterium]|nr:ATP synthase F1 subunit delta [Alphaproteobacteria bacterium]